MDIGKKKIRCVNFLVDHANKMVSGAYAVTLCALSIVNPLAGLGTLLGWGCCKMVHSHKYSPYLRSKLEKIFPFISSLGACFSEYKSTRIMAIYNITCEIFYHIDFKRICAIEEGVAYCLRKISYLSRLPVNRNIANVLRFEDLRWKAPENLSYEQIQQVLQARDSDFEINTRHCNKLIRKADVKGNNHFEMFVPLFQKTIQTINWERKYAALINGLIGDDRWVDQLAIELELSTEAIKKDMKGSITSMAAKKNKTPEQLIKTHLTERMVHFSKTLKEELPFLGNVNDFLLVQNYAATILGHLESASVQQTEDILLRIAIETGDYCGAAYLGCLREVVDEISLESSAEDPNAALTGVERDDRLLEQMLLQNRNHLANCLINGVNVPSTFGDKRDRHNIEDVNIWMYGFLPVEERKLLNWGILDWMMHKITWNARYALTKQYLALLVDAERGGIVFEFGANRFSDMILRTIEMNPLLIEDQKESLRNQLSDTGDMKSWVRLIYVKLGVLTCHALCRSHP